MTDYIQNIPEELLQQSILRIDENLVKVEKCLDELKEEEIWQRSNESSNSIGNLILHLCGNITQYIISSLGNAKDIRERDLEFNATGGLSKSELYEKLTDVAYEAKNVIREINLEDLTAIRSVQGFKMSGIGIIIHVVEHFSYHTGQIAFWTKMIKNIDLGFYNDLDLNQKNLSE